MKVNTTKKGFVPKTGIIEVRPIMDRPRNPMITDPNHEAYFLFSTSTINYCLPMDRNGNLINPFSSNEEKEWLEQQLDTNLSVSKRKENFWFEFKVSLGKDPLILDLSKAKDYLSYLLLKSNKMFIAPDWASRKKKRTYRYAIVEQGEIIKEEASSTSVKIEAYSIFSTLSKSEKDMQEFLKVYGRNVSSFSKKEFLINEIDKIILKEPNKFIEILKDKENFTLRLLIEEAVHCSALRKSGKLYYLPGGDPLCSDGDVPTIFNAVEFLKQEKNQDILTMLEARVANAKE